MNCHDIDAALFAGGELSPQAREHLAGCANCRVLAASIKPEAIDAAVLGRVRAQIPEDLKAVKPLASTRAYAGFFLLIAAILAALTAASKGILGLPALSAVQTIAIFTVLLISLGVAAVAVARDMRPGARSIRALLLFAIALAAIEAVFLTLFHDYRMGRFLHWGMGCFRMGLACAAVTAVLVWFPVRRGYVVAPVSTGAAIGALAGLAGLSALEMHCPILNIPHLTIWHAGVLAASVGLGALAGRIARR